MLFLVIFCIILFLYLHVYFHLKVNNDLEILELENELTKDKLSNICDLRQPLLFYYDSPEILKNFSKDYLTKEHKTIDLKIRNKSDKEFIDLPLQFKLCDDLFSKDISSNYISSQNYDFLKESGLIKKLKPFDLFLKPSLTCKTDYDVLTGSENASTFPEYKLSYRNFLYATNNSVNITLYPPKEHKNIDIEKDYDKFLFYANDVSKGKDKLELTLLEGQMLFIPSYWVYEIRYTKDSIVLQIEYFTFMNLLSIIPDLILSFLQKQNIKINTIPTYSNKIDS